MRKLTSILCTLFLVLSPGFAHNRASLVRHVQKKVEAGHSALYTQVERELQNYYGRNDFSDPRHQTGWYRVDDFLTWVRIHSQELEGMIRTSAYDDCYARESGAGQSFWLQLGVLYIASVYGIKADISKLPVMFGVDDDVRASSGKDRLKVFTGTRKIAPVLINEGIHEGTHILPILSSGNVREDHLDELAAFYSQYNYGLPVKVSDAQNFGSGIRDFRRTYALKGDFELSREYNYFVAGIILNPLLTKQEMLQRQDGWMGAWTNMAIWTTLANLISLRDENYFKLEEISGPDMKERSGTYFSQKGFEYIYDSPGIPFYAGEYQLSSGEKIAVFVRYDEDLDDVFFESGIRMNREDYLQKLFGNRAPVLYNFYDFLINNLPDEVVQKARELWSVQEDGMFMITGYSYFPGWEQFGKPYSAQITQAVVKALKDSGAPPPPPIPEGYM
ncbi:MAG: hypothetical protein IKP06_04180 [Elusimicrobiaceae bacterium]|nr:hypothetical protein [Elusimicrobiaceae bacterium]